MERIVVAAKAGADQPWVADAAAQLAEQPSQGGCLQHRVVDLEALSPLPRSEYQQARAKAPRDRRPRSASTASDANAETPSGKVGSQESCFSPRNERRHDRRRRVLSRQGRAQDPRDVPPSSWSARAGRLLVVSRPTAKRGKAATWPPGTPALRSTFATKPVRSAGQGHRAASSAPVGLLDLTALGIGAIIGTGIFVILGEAIGDSGTAPSSSASSSPA
jgi:hypothetical protein